MVWDRRVSLFWIIFASCLLPVLACPPYSEKQKMQSEQNSVRFDLKSGAITVDSNGLERMKAAMQSFFDGPEFPARFTELLGSIQAELKSSAVWVHQGQAGIGVWKLENRDGNLELVRYPPPRNGTSYLYHAKLASEGSGWKVVSLEQEREFGPA